MSRRNVSPELVFHAAGNACADKMAGVGAEWALERALVGELPRTDTWDAISALVRQRARRAMVDTLAVDPWDSQRSERVQRPRTSSLETTLARSQHAWTKVQGRWLCTRCRMIAPSSQIFDVAETPCSPVVATPVGQGSGFPPGVEAVTGALSVGGREVHSSHRMHVWHEYSLLFCSVCGKSATTDARHLCKRCEPSKKGRENLARIRKGIFPSHQGAPKVVQEARRVFTSTRGSSGSAGPI